jgi:FKBP-type peptidyl-prolyl cis-trans isomerase SlyD
VTKIESGKLTVDGNHPLAGKTLKLTVKILDVRDATAEDARTSGIHSTNGPTLN